MNTNAKHRILSLALAVCLLLGMTLYLPGPVEVSAAETVIQVNTLTLLAFDSGPGWTYTPNSSDPTICTLTITDHGAYILTGTNLNLQVIIDADVEITLRNATIGGRNPIRCDGYQVNLRLEGSNTLKGGSEGIKVPAASKLTIGGDGYLDVKGGGVNPGIGNYGDCGEILITDHARVDASSEYFGAGIGTAASASLNAGIVTITGNAVVSAQGGSISGPDIGSDNVNGHPGTLHVGGGATLNLNHRGTNVAPSDLEIGECTINGNTGTYEGTYHWLLVEDGTLDPTTVKPFWLTDGAGRQIVRAGDWVTVDALPGFAQWYHSPNLVPSGLTDNPVTFQMPNSSAWIAATNLSRPLSVTPGTLSLDMDSNRTGIVTPDMGINDSDGLSPLATQVTAVSSDPDIAEVEYGPHTGDVTVTAKGPGDAAIVFTFNDPTPTTLSVAVNVAASTKPGPSVSTPTLELAVEETDTFFVSLGEGYNGAESAAITGFDTGIVTVSPLSLGQSGDVKVKGVAEGETTITIGYSGGILHGKSDTVQVTVTGDDDGDPDPGPGPNPTPGGSGSSRSSSRSSGSGYTAPVRAQLPASAFSWDGRTLTINQIGITTLGLTRVLWNDVETTAFNVYQGSVIIRFDEAFLAAQSPGTHTIRVEFLGHTGETTVTVGGGVSGGTSILPTGDTDNPDTGLAPALWGSVK